MAYNFIEFIETPTFTRQVQELLSDDEYCRLQFMLASDPEWRGSSHLLLAKG